MSKVRGTGAYDIDASEFAALFRELDGIDKKLALQIRKRLRDEGKPLVKKMQAAVTDPKSKRSAKIVNVRTRTRKVKGIDFDGSEITERETYTREERTTTARLVAKGIGFSIRTGQTGGSVAFTSSGRALPANRKAMFRALNKPKFRHPTFGDRDKWVEQAGRPYFGAVILEERDRLLEAIDRAMDDIAKNIGRSRIRR